MALAGAALIKRRIRQRFGIRAPRVTVRAHIPWYFWGGLLVVGFFLLVAFASWLYESGRQLRRVDSAAAEFDRLQGRERELVSEVSRLRQIVDTGESKYQIEQTTGLQLARQVKVLESENASLKEDLAFFEGLVPGGDMAKEGGPKISRFRVEPDFSVGQYRYRMLIVQVNGKSRAVFHGGLQLAIKLQQGGKDVMMIMPAAGAADSQRFDLNIKYFQRVEGGFVVPAGSVVRSVEARLLQNGSVLSRQVLTL